jgi:hypothetical protein
VGDPPARSEIGVVATAAFATDASVRRGESTRLMGVIGAFSGVVGVDRRTIEQLGNEMLLQVTRKRLRPRTDLG